MLIMIAGASGFIGQHLVNHWRQDHHLMVVGRSRKKLVNRFPATVECFEWSELNEIDSTKIDIVINLCGTNIGRHRWTNDIKNEIINSRVETTERLIQWLSQNEAKPHFYCANAIGLYGLQQTPNPAAKTEDDVDSIAAKDFLAEVALKWKNAAEQAITHHIPLTITCFGVVLDKEDGMLKKLTPVFKLGLGSVIGNGQQMISWVHIQDLIKAFDFLTQRPDIQGVINICSPKPIRQKTFAQQLAKALHRPLLLHTPAFIIKLLFGEMGQCLILQGQSVYPKRLIDKGFEFTFDDVGSALLEAYRTK